jgi:hypothetical protein
MFTGAVLVVWFGFAQSQTLSVTNFDTMEQCLGAKVALDKRFENSWHYEEENVECLPYTAAAE